MQRRWIGPRSLSELPAGEEYMLLELGGEMERAVVLKWDSVLVVESGALILMVVAVAVVGAWATRLLERWWLGDKGGRWKKWFR